MVAMPITIEAVQRAHPINAWMRIVKIFLELIAFSYDYSFISQTDLQASYELMEKLLAGVRVGVDLTLLEVIIFQTTIIEYHHTGSKP